MTEIGEIIGGPKLNPQHPQRLSGDAETISNIGRGAERTFRKVQDGDGEGYESLEKIGERVEPNHGETRVGIERLQCSRVVIVELQYRVHRESVETS